MKLGSPLAMVLFVACVTIPAHAVVRDRRAPDIPFVQPVSGVFPAVQQTLGVDRPAASGFLAGFQQSAQRPFIVSWNEATGRARSLSQGLSRAYGTDAVPAARAFLADAAALFGPEASPDALHLAGSRPTAFGTQVRFLQTVDGVPILGREVTVNMTAADEAMDAENTTAPAPVVSTTPRISLMAVAGMAKGRIVKEPTLAVDADAPEPRLVWRMIYSPSSDHLLRVTVDAQTGDRLLTENLVQTFVTGTGMVYTGNPVSTPTLTSQPLPGLQASGTLTGQYAKVYQGDPPGTQTVNESSLTFNYAPGDTRLAEVEAYYGINTIHDYFKNNLGFTGRDSQMPAYVHIDGLDNAYYSSYIGSDGGMEFGYVSSGSYTVEYSLDCDVLYHEYTHSVVDKVAPAFSMEYDYYHEQGGINEGLADYFSCSELNDPVLAEYALGTDYGRDLRNRNHFPEDLPLAGYASSAQRYYQTFPEVHRTGEIWGPACWDLRMALGQTKADKLLFTAMSLFTATTTMQDAVSKIITADSQLYGGANTVVIRQVFAGRGLTDTTYPISYLTPTSFYSSSGTSKIKTGYVYTSDSVFYDYISDCFIGLGMFPALVADRWYCFVGYTEDSTVNSVFVILKDTSGRNIAYSGTNTTLLSAMTTSGAKTYRYITTWFKFPSSLVSSGNYLTGRIAVNSYTQSASTVQAAFTSGSPLTPRASAPSSGTVYTARLLKVRPGDTNTDGAVTLRDAILSLRYVTGQDSLSGWEAAQSDVVAPFTGQPDMDDVKQMMKIAAGLG